jgi:hypothetical protein
MPFRTVIGTLDADLESLRKQGLSTREIGA